MESGIYKIRNKKNDKVYIGSSRNIERRFREHKVYLKNDSHCNNHLQNSWNKYGKENFEFKPVLYCSVDDLVFYEQRTIDSYKACDRKFGYNIKPKADDSQLS